MTWLEFAHNCGLDYTIRIIDESISSVLFTVNNYNKNVEQVAVDNLLKQHLLEYLYIAMLMTQGFCLHGISHNYTYNYKYNFENINVIF